jgi:hypothetical protein
VLATNRGVARIDPRASTQLAVGDQEDILTGIQQLAQLYGAVQSGGALAALGALQQLPREPQPEVCLILSIVCSEATPPDCYAALELSADSSTKLPSVAKDYRLILRGDSTR